MAHLKKIFRSKLQKLWNLKIINLWRLHSGISRPSNFSWLERKNSGQIRKIEFRKNFPRLAAEKRYNPDAFQRHVESLRRQRRLGEVILQPLEPLFRRLATSFSARQKHSDCSLFILLDLK